MLKNLFNEKKAAQVAAYFLFRAGGQLSVLKLTKLLYLAERRALEQFGEPMIGDRPVSMPHGPVLSTTLDHMNGMLESGEGGWDSWVADRQGHVLALKDPQRVGSPEDLLELSPSEIAILDAVWGQFGGMNQWALRDWTHEHCAEWRDPEGSSVPISPEALFAALHFSPQQSENILARLREVDAINAAFAAAAPLQGQ